VEQVESKEYSWKWVTADELLSISACELLFAHLVVSSANGHATLYDGENTAGNQIVYLQAATETGMQFHPLKPVFCRRGLYVGNTSHLEGVFVQWRELPQGIGHSV